MDISTMEWGPDVSHFHPVRDWPAFAASGATFFGTKATEGTHTVDSYFEFHRDGFRRHCSSFRMGVYYHFFHCEKDPSTQAEFLIRTVGDLRPNERLCCDFEEKSYSNVEAQALLFHGLAWLEDFFARLDELMPNMRPLIYTSARHWRAIGDQMWPRAARMDLWVPRYNDSATPPDELPRPWSDWSVFQFTDGNAGPHRDVPGIGFCDCNVFANQCVVR